MQLHPVAIGAGVRLEALATTGSTNAEALARARAGDPGPLWITAQRQTAGRGRRGRTWVSEPGNLYATLLLTDPSPVERAAELSFVAALAVHDAATQLAPDLAGRLALKWPNDVLVDGAKVAGILLESEGEAGRPLAVAVGIGVNCAHHPDATSYPATDLASSGVPMAPERLFAALSCAMVERLAQWNRARGFAAVRADWLARAAGVGDVIRVVAAERELEGRLETLNDAGHLVLRLSDGSFTAVPAGDVFPLVPPTVTARSRKSA
jgi:BirA family biotin operon repressor/biotin-[acetyl-CoA-carboxylase] ligase